MKHAWILAITLFALVGCGSNVAPPRNPENACAIVTQRRDFGRAVSTSERKWGVPAHLLLATMYHESSFRGDARPPRKGRTFLIFPGKRISSAYGYSQALDGTWEDYKRGPGGGMARRDNVHHAADFMGWYMAETSRTLGVSRSDGYHQYLAYHEGRGGYARGSYRSKGWLTGVARKVEARSQLYRVQLSNCGRR